jgi:predicted RNase H-like nuclease (RuvC/YqgF family)
VELLDKYRQQNPVGEKQIEKDDYIKYLEGENARLIGEENSLLKKVAALESLLREQSDQIAEAKYNQLMLESKDKRIEELERVRDSQQQELDSFEKSLFGFYRKK